MATNNIEISSESESELDQQPVLVSQNNRGRSHSATLLNTFNFNSSHKINKSCLHQRSFDYGVEFMSSQNDHNSGGILLPALKSSRRKCEEKRMSHSRSPPLSILTNTISGDQPEISVLHVNPAALLANSGDLDGSVSDDYQSQLLADGPHSSILNDTERHNNDTDDDILSSETVMENKEDEDNESESGKLLENASKLDSDPNAVCSNQSALIANTVLNAKLIPNIPDLRRASTASIGNGNSAFHPATKSNRYPRYVVSLLNERSSVTTGVRLLVDGVRFIVDPSMLRAYPNTMLGRMFSSPLNVNRTADGDIPLAEGISASVFGILLDYYRGKPMRCPAAISVQDLKDACDYFLIPFSHQTVRCSNLRSFLHEISNDGAYELFEHFLEEEVLPQMVKCAQVGERECHIVVLTDDDIIDWDDNYPPQMPENELRSHIVHSTQMFRFLKYIENREVAKHVLTERGLKKIRIGIEGYPMYKEKIKRRSGYRPEVIYNYAQRPFLRMSWEEEENKSRHVDFQCVKSKSVTDLTSLEQVAVDRPVDLPSSLTPPTAVRLIELMPHAYHQRQANSNTPHTNLMSTAVNTISSNASASSDLSGSSATSNYP